MPALGLEQVANGDCCSLGAGETGASRKLNTATGMRLNLAQALRVVARSRPFLRVPGQVSCL